MEFEYWNRAILELKTTTTQDIIDTTRLGQICILQPEPCNPASLKHLCLYNIHTKMKLTRHNRNGFNNTTSDYSFNLGIIQRLNIPETLKHTLLNLTIECKIHGHNVISTKSNTARAWFLYITPNSTLHKRLLKDKTFNIQELNKYYSRDNLMKQIIIRYPHLSQLGLKQEFLDLLNRDTQLSNIL